MDGLYEHMTEKEERDAWKHAYETHDRRKAGEIKTQELGLLLRSLTMQLTRTQHDMPHRVTRATLQTGTAQPVGLSAAASAAAAAVSVANPKGGARQ